MARALKRREPVTDAEWQDAVDGAVGFRAIADCKMYGLVVGGPKIDVARCDEILERGKARGIEPSRPVNEIVMDLVREINSRDNGIRSATTDQEKPSALRF